MNAERFKAIAAALLERHYGLELNDTHLCDDEIVELCIQDGCRPYEAIAEHAIDTELDRIDKEGAWGIPSRVPITAEDEDAAIEGLPAEGAAPARERG